jgi:hypothetical protein
VSAIKELADALEHCVRDMRFSCILRAVRPVREAMVTWERAVYERMHANQAFRYAKQLSQHSRLYLPNQAYVAHRARLASGVETRGGEWEWIWRMVFSLAR